MQVRSGENVFRRTQNGALDNAGVNWEYRENAAVEFRVMLPAREVVDYPCCGDCPAE